MWWVMEPEGSWGQMAQHTPSLAQRVRYESNATTLEWIQFNTNEIRRDPETPLWSNMEGKLGPRLKTSPVTGVFT